LCVVRFLLSRVRKHFPGHGWFDGAIRAFDGVYRVRYDDEEEEEYCYDSPELSNIILQHGKQ